MAGASIHACRNSGRHLVAYEEDSALFDAILSPLSDPLPTTSVGGFMPHNASIDSDEEHVKKVARKNRLNTQVFNFSILFANLASNVWDVCTRSLTLMILFCRKKNNMTSSPNMGLPIELSFNSNEFGRVLLIIPSMVGKLKVHASEVVWRFEPIAFHIGELSVKLILATHAPQARMIINIVSKEDIPYHVTIGDIPHCTCPDFTKMSSQALGKKRKWVNL